jgi:2,3-dimethylmalate lyase
LVIIARTDALQPNGWDDAVERLRAYRGAGADLAFMDGLKTRELVERAAGDLTGIPQLLNSWLLTPKEARAMGFAVYIHLGVMLRHFSDFRRSLEDLRESGRVAVPRQDLSVEPITRLLGGGQSR